MHRVLFEIPGTPIKLFGFGVMLALAFLAAIAVAAWRARRERLDPDTVYDLAFWVIIGGLIGARGLYVAQYWGTRIRSFGEVFKFWEGGIVFYGGMIGATLAGLAFWGLRRFPLRPMLDVVAPSVALGLALGRVGCFLNGCCFGDPCALPWAVQFPPGSPPWWDQVMTAVEHPARPEGLGLAEGVAESVRLGIEPPGTPWSHPVHPAQLYSAVDGAVIFLFLSAFYPLRRRDGEVFAAFLTIYPLTRLLIEQIRGDEAAFLAGLTISQTVSIGLLLAAAAFWAYLLSQPAGQLHASPAGPAQSPSPA